MANSQHWVPSTRSLGDAGIAYWLFGGWAVDFHAGRITRPHDDIDIAVWLEDVPRIAELLTNAGWIHAPESMKTAAPDSSGPTSGSS